MGCESGSGEGVVGLSPFQAARVGYRVGHESRFHTRSCGDVFLRIGRRIASAAFPRAASRGGIGLPEAVAMYLDTVKPAHEKYVEPCKGRADLVIDDVLDDRTLDAVVQAIEELRAKRCEGPGKEQNL